MGYACEMSNFIPGGSEVKNLRNAGDVATWVRSLSQADLLEKEMATRSSVLAWEISWTEKPGGYSPWGCKRVGHN